MCAVLSLVLAAGFSSCTTVLAEAELSYQEQIVLSAVLTAGDTVRNIHIMRSAPPLGKIDYAQHGLPDAKITLLLNGSPVATRRQMILPAFTTQGLNPDKRTFFEAPGVVVQSGQRFTITVEWSGKRITASTVIPSAPNVVEYQTVDILTNGGSLWRYIQAVVRPGNGEAYSVLAESFFITPRNPNPSPTFSEAPAVVQNPLAPADTMQIRTLVSSGASSSQDTTRYFARVAAYDAPFAAYSQSLRSGSTFIRWNVQGDGIGIFVGAALGERRAVRYP